MPVPGFTQIGDPVGTSARRRVLAEVSHAFATVVTDYPRLVETSERLPTSWEMDVRSS